MSDNDSGWLDNYLDNEAEGNHRRGAKPDPDTTPIGNAFGKIPKKKPTPSWQTKPVQTPPAPQVDGYVVCPKIGSYHARGVLKSLRGYYDADYKAWYVPERHKDLAFDACREAARRDAEFTADEVKRLMDSLNNVSVDFGTCWECGGSLGEFPKSGGGAQWSGTQQVLKQGAVVAEAYCGCVERGDARRKNRPDFRQGRFSTSTDFGF